MLSDRSIELTKEVILKAPSTGRTAEERAFVRKVQRGGDESGGADTGAAE